MGNVAASRSAGSAGHASSSELGDGVGDDVVAMLYRAMARARAVDARMALLHRQGAIGAHASAQGDEASIIGAAGALRDGDWIFGSHREVGAALMRGAPLDAYAHHMFGNAEHFAPRAARFVAASTDDGRVGAHVTHAAGLAWAAKMKGEDTAALVYFDARATEGAEVHNGANFAGVMRAPLVMMCRGVAARGVAYGIPTVECDASDVVAIYKCVRDALKRGGPTWIEALPSARDPLARVREQLEARGAWNDAMEREAQDSIARGIDDAVAKAEAAGPPAANFLFENVYATLPRHLDEQRALRVPRK